MARPLHLALMFCHAAGGSPDASFRVILEPQARLPNKTEALATASARKRCYTDRSLLLASVQRLLVYIIQSAMQLTEFIPPKCVLMGAHCTAASASDGAAVGNVSSKGSWQAFI
jgi:hypothetical protein